MRRDGISLAEGFWQHPPLPANKAHGGCQTCGLDPMIPWSTMRWVCLSRGTVAPACRNFAVVRVRHIVWGGKNLCPFTGTGLLCSQLHSALKYLCWPDGKWRCVEKGVQTVDLLTQAFATWLRLFKICDLQLSHSLPIEEEWKISPVCNIGTQARLSQRGNVEILT